MPKNNALSRLLIAGTAFATLSMTSCVKEIDAPAANGESVSSEAVTNRNGEQEFVPNELLVKFKNGTASVSAVEAHNEFGAVVLEQFPELKWQRIKLPAGVSFEQAISRYKNMAEVEAVQINRTVKCGADVAAESLVTLEAKGVVRLGGRSRELELESARLAAAVGAHQMPRSAGICHATFYRPVDRHRPYDEEVIALDGGAVLVCLRRVLGGFGASGGFVYHVVLPWRHVASADLSIEAARPQASVRLRDSFVRAGVPS